MPENKSQVTHSKDYDLLAIGERAGRYRRELRSALKEYLTLLSNIAAQPPVWFSLSFVGLDGTEIFSNDFLRTPGRPIREKKLLFPLQEIEEVDVDPAVLLKPNWDKLWNAAGFSHSPNN